MPPSLLFVGVSGPPKVPSCRACNGGSSGEDTYFRLTVVASEQAEKHPAARAVWETAFRGLQRPEAAGLKHAFYGSIRPVDLLDEASGTVRRVFALESKGARHGRVVARIARGLYYRDTAGILPDHHVMAWPLNFVEQNERDERRRLTDMAYRMWNTVKDRPPTELGSGVLNYWWESFGGKYVAWFFVFYDGMAFFAMAIPREARPLLTYFAPFEFPPSSPTSDLEQPAAESVEG